ncbi:type II secretion system protein H [Spongiibacter sp. IMCC21906]|uniref:type II secretion system minor pseudopilin GspH n=1 Tax=Spongiibacter sp. IMCC21906 TaxID=1620392 RepID=UPI00062DFE3C|nr:type II secretion system minor pseudopilin GspH [Spongiibacter sp. IMCC21906]AKH69486.1 type II secretion system protein H [Spongiibacter sp. IMCC21906]
MAKIWPATSLTGRSNRGFSLLELLVVIFIIGLLSGVAVLTLPGKDGAALLNEQRYSLLAGLRSARAEAVFSGRSLGLVWKGAQGSFHVLTQEGWLPIQDGVLAKPLKMDSAVQSEITVAGEPLKQPEAQSADSDDEKNTTPQILFLGDGQVSPFEWRLLTDGAESVMIDQSLRLEDDQ